jgi:tetratricopeptide (TPR) repeat protein
MGTALVLAICLTVTVTGSAAEENAEAKAAYQDGKAHYEAGRYQEAMDAFTKAYNLTSEPNLLFNLAAAAERLGENDRAIAYYEVYLEEIPNAPDADEVRANIERLKAGPPPASEETSETETESPPPSTSPSPPPQDVDPESYYDLGPKPEETKPPIWPKLTIGLGTMLVAGGVITSILAYNEYKGLKSTCKPDCTDEDISTAKGLALASDLQFGFGGATLVAGIVGLVLTNKKHKRESARLEVSPAERGLGVQGRF